MSIRIQIWTGLLLPVWGINEADVTQQDGSLIDDVVATVIMGFSNIPVMLRQTSWPVLILKKNLIHWKWNGFFFYHVHGQLLNLDDTLSPSSGTYTLNVKKNALKTSVSKIKGHIPG